MSKRKSSSYTEELRQSSAKLAYEPGQPVSTTADNLAVHEATLYSWISKYYPNRSKRQKIDQAVDLYGELKLLRKENKRFFPVGLMCAVLQVSTSCYYHLCQAQPSKCAQEKK